MALRQRAVNQKTTWSSQGGEARQCDMPHRTDWYPMDPAQVAPAQLLTDPWLRLVMTAERCAQVLATPRGPQ